MFSPLSHQPVKRRFVLLPRLSAWVQLMRPHQWTKNVFVLAGLMFSGAWSDPDMVTAVMRAFAAFCAAASLVYVLNDWHDREADALHPRKRGRPLAAGQAGLADVLGLVGVLLAATVALAGDNGVLLTLLGLYVLVNLMYSSRLRQVPVVDVSLISSGFMLRLLAGTEAVGIAPSRWMLLAGIFVALFLGFSKRKAESFQAPGSQRPVMASYPPALLDTFVAVTMTAALMTYSLFATSPEAQQQHGERLIYTVPLVIFGMLRFAYQVHRGQGEDVTLDLLRDPWIVGALLAWALVFWGPWS